LLKSILIGGNLNKIDPKNYYAQTYSQRIDTLIQEENAEGMRVLKSTSSRTPVPSALPDAPPSNAIIIPRGSLVMYRELLKDVWFDGKVTEEETKELAALRELFNITQKEHLQLEHETKIEAYLEALRIAWRDNVITDMEHKTLSMMKEKYGITPEDQAIAEQRFSELKRPVISRGVILVVDADREILVTLSKRLKPRGFSVLMASRPEDALQILLRQLPSLIISDVFFPANQMDGVEFFNKLREHSILRKTPFIFTSSIKEKKIIQAAYRIGVDHVLTKPIDTELLLAILEGKILESK
jgi:CheY-like chemotaxis protein